MPFETTALRKALASLRAATEQPYDEFLRDSVIKRFEYSYELSWKLLKRYLEIEVGETVDASTRRELFRVAAKYGLIGSIDLWMEFHKARNESSHTYNEVTAQEVYQAALQFLPEAEQLEHNLNEHGRQP